MFKSIWFPFVSETLAMKQEKGNSHNCFAVAVILRQSRPAVTAIVNCIAAAMNNTLRCAMNIKRICIVHRVVNVY